MICELNYLKKSKWQVLKPEVHVRILADYISHETRHKICVRHFPRTQTWDKLQTPYNILNSYLALVYFFTTSHLILASSITKLLTLQVYWLCPDLMKRKIQNLILHLDYIKSGLRALKHRQTLKKPFYCLFSIYSDMSVRCVLLMLSLLCVVSCSSERKALISVWNCVQKSFRLLQGIKPDQGTTALKNYKIRGEGLSWILSSSWFMENWLDSILTASLIQSLGLIFLAEVFDRIKTLPFNQYLW